MICGCSHAGCSPKFQWLTLHREYGRSVAAAEHFQERRESAGRAARSDGGGSIARASAKGELVAVHAGRPMSGRAGRWVEGGRGGPAGSTLRGPSRARTGSGVLCVAYAADRSLWAGSFPGPAASVRYRLASAVLGRQLYGNTFSGVVDGACGHPPVVTTPAPTAGTAAADAPGRA